MRQKTNPEEWVWIVIQNPGGDEQILGQKETESKISFIPAFKTKEEALNGLLHMQRENRSKYEVQAIILEDLITYAGKNRFLLFILDDKGKILEKIDPMENDDASK